jgi:uncharacterized protein (TIGR00299 family) protein
MRVLYFDAFSGMSGDMTVGAMLALGLPLATLRDTLATLPLDGYSVSATDRHVNGIAATKFDVNITARQHAHRPFRQIRNMIEASSLDPPVQRTALKIFEKLARAEARVHGTQPDEVEFHEVGAVDSIVDIVGAALGYTWLGIERAYVSKLPLGSGLVNSQHGRIPVPGPATAELLRGFPVCPEDGEGEILTPTGAAIVAALATPGPLAEMRIEKVGYGAGTRTLEDRPNILRLVVGEHGATTASDSLFVLETNIDDYNPEFYDYLMERLFEAGARDVYLTPVHMKKNRPGIVLNILGTEPDREMLSGIVLSETSAIGVRYHPVRRVILSREIRHVHTPYGEVRVKVARDPDGRENLAPEYEDCKRVARASSVPIKLVHQAALAAAGSQRNE